MMSIIVFCEIGIVCLYCSLQMEKREWVKREKKRTIEKQTLCSLNVVFIVRLLWSYWIEMGSIWKIKMQIWQTLFKACTAGKIFYCQCLKKTLLVSAKKSFFLFFQDSVKPIKAKRENITNKQKRAREWWWEWHIVVTFAVPFLWDYAEILGTKLKGNKRWSECFAKYFFMVKKT